jgi:uncharacterized protein (DUF1330 family)
VTKGYWIGRLNIHDQAAYDRYRALNGEAFRKYGARFLVRGGDFERLEGEAKARNVVIEFPTYRAAHDCWHSPEYRRARKERLDAIDLDLIVIEGYDGPQP